MIWYVSICYNVSFRIISLLYHYYTYFFSFIFPIIFPLTILLFFLWLLSLLLYYYYNIIILIIFILFLIISGVHIPIYRSWQTQILVLCAERWLTSVLGRKGCFVINRRACFINPSQHIQLNENYYTNYILYYTYYFDFWPGLSRL